ncbi:MAG: carbon-phosphorus lyase complex subunit PhnI [Alphaproteobacteria bacterium]|nr:carbon-phosphorus lyase complex subunit PhnI [Alphaproteobacteria bacterium]
MYVAVKGGEKSIANAHKLLAEDRRGNKDVPALSVTQIKEQLYLSVSRVMTEGSLYDPDLAALAIKQARGDLIEAIFLIRAYRTTLSRFAYGLPISTSNMQIDRRISATYKDLPGGQVLGPTFDYTHRLIDFDLASEQQKDSKNSADPSEPSHQDARLDREFPRVLDSLLRHEGLIQSEACNSDAPSDSVGDLTREPISFPANRDIRLQNLSRADEGFILSIAYSTQRGYARNHAFVGEIRFGTVELVIEPEELGFPISIGDMDITECETVNQFTGSKIEPPQFTRGYGLTFGQNERKAIAMALVDRALRAREIGEEIESPAQDEEFVLSHSDNIQATGFVEHIKLPHYVDFQAELELVRRLRTEAEALQESLHSSQNAQAAE